jgi:hypothetical protein
LAQTNSDEEAQELYKSLMCKLDELLGHGLELNVDPEEVATGGLSEMGTEDVAAFIERVCPADGDCTKCPSQDACKAHEDQCLDIEDL